MTCRELNDFLLAYLDGDLSAEQHAQFTEHLKRCPPCIHYFHSYQETVCICRAAFAEPPEPLPDELVTAILTARRGQRSC